MTAMLISFAAFGQDEPNAIETGFRRFLLGINISPDYCDRKLKNNDGSSSSSMIIDVLDKVEKFKIGYTAGLNACYRISRRLGIELGVQYSNKGYSIKKQELTSGNISDPRYGFVYTNGPETPVKGKFIYNYIYLDVPARVIYSFGEKRFHFVASIGVAANIHLKTTLTSYLEYANGDKKRETHDLDYDIRTMNISPFISAGANYRISKRINLSAEPTFRYGVLKIMDTPVTAYLWNAGLNITCYYAIR